MGKGVGLAGEGSSEYYLERLTLMALALAGRINDKKPFRLVTVSDSDFPFQYDRSRTFSSPLGSAAHSHHYVPFL